MNSLKPSGIESLALRFSRQWYDAAGLRDLVLYADVNLAEAAEYAVFVEIFKTLAHAVGDGT